MDRCRVQKQNVECDRKKHEIGGEFWINSFQNKSRKKEEFSGRKKGFLSGRTALDYIIREAKSTIGFKSVLLPSYCCYTMIEPFINNEIGVRFYSVTLGEEGLQYMFPAPKEEEALYLMLYFGFGKMSAYEQEQVRQWKFCILDETHSCFSGHEVPYTKWNIKYTYASYRKWADIKGFAVAEKVDEDFLLPYVERNHKEYLQKKTLACSLKQLYINERKGDKPAFLKLYAEAEKMLDTDYRDFAFLQEGVIAYEMLDIEKVQKKRRKNGQYLLDEIKKIEGIKAVYSSIADSCPLYIPILVADGLRDGLRDYLIGEEIYCPVHWPVSKFHDLRDVEERKLYEQELSLVCDQRYDIDDMQRTIKCILDYFEK